MFDGLTGEKRWNVTFFDYASQPVKESDYGNLFIVWTIYSGYNFKNRESVRKFS